MSWAGKIKLTKRIRSLFRKGQAPVSSGVSSGALDPALRLAVEKKVQRWVDGKGYRLAENNVRDVARRMGTDSVTLYRYFREKGLDFRTWRAGLRIEDAKAELLREPRTSASTIARRVGINDRSNFLRQFSRHCGMTPEEWRRQNSSL